MHEVSTKLASVNVNVTKYVQWRNQEFALGGA